METYAKRLQELVRDHVGVDVPIVDQRAWPRPEAPAHAIIIAPGQGFGDMYSGGVDVEELRFELPRTDGGEPLRLTYSVGIHQLSGQCDLDRLVLENARPDEVESLRAIFMPRRKKPYGRDLSELIVNGTRVDPWDAS